jgi:hypothetical protein
MRREIGKETDYNSIFAHWGLTQGKSEMSFRPYD